MKRGHIVYLFLWMLFLSPFAAQGSHYYGGTLRYECLAPDSFRIWHHEYYDCMAVTAPYPSLTITGFGGSCPGPSSTGTWSAVVSVDITPLAPGPIPPCQGGTTYFTPIGERTAYRDIKFPPTACSKYRVSVTSCCRNSTSAGLSGPTDYTQRIDTLIVNGSTCNSSPIWVQDPIILIQAGQNSIIDQHAVDPDGDSVSYRLSAPWIYDNVGASYNIGFSPTQPLGPSWGVSIHPAYGWVYFVAQPGNVLSSHFAITAEEWRNGVKINESHRDILLTAANAGAPGCAGNNLPALDSMSAAIDSSGNLLSAIINDTVYFSPGDTGVFNLQFSDPDAGNASQVVWFGNLPGGWMEDLGGTPADTILGIDPWVSLNWPTANYPGIYTTYFALIDTTCNLNSMQVLPVVIIVGDTSLVWPGDANHDFIANNLDLFAIGYGYANTGPVRPSASNSWVGQPATTWLDTIPGPVDMKHADCNGDGIINASDTTAIILNYGLIHTKGHTPLRATGTDPILHFDLSTDSAGVGDTLTAAIILGDALLPASNVFGVAFTLSYDPAAIDSSTFRIDFTPSWFGDNLNSISLDYNHATAFLCDAAQVRTTHTTASGFGQIASASFVIIDNIDGKRHDLDSVIAYFHFTDVHIIGLNGEMIPVSPVGDTLRVYELSVERPQGNPVAAPSVFPVPSQGLIQVSATGHALQQFDLYDLRGRLLQSSPGQGRSQQRLDLGALPKGVYILQIRTDLGTYAQRVVLD